MPAGYCTGMSQPANSTIRAERRRWSALSGVRRSDVVSLEGKAGAKNLCQKDRDLCELLGEQEHAHADNQHAAHSLNSEHMRSYAAYDAERTIDGQTGQKERHTQSKRVDNQQRDAFSNRLLLRGQAEQACQKGPNARGPTCTERKSEHERTRMVGLRVRLGLGKARRSIQPRNAQDPPHVQ